MGKGGGGWKPREYSDMKAKGRKHLKQGLRQIAKLHFLHLLNGNINASCEVIVKIINELIHLINMY